MGSVLRHRFELMFQEAGLDIPVRLIETSSILFMTKMLQESDFIAVVPTEVARYYTSYGMVAMLPIQLSCTMDAFGIILRKDWLLSPAAKVVLKALKTAAITTYADREFRSPQKYTAARSTSSCRLRFVRVGYQTRYRCRAVCDYSGIPLPGRMFVGTSGFPATSTHTLHGFGQEETPPA